MRYYSISIRSMQLTPMFTGSLFSLTMQKPKIKPQHVFTMGLGFPPDLPSQGELRTSLNPKPAESQNQKLKHQALNPKPLNPKPPRLSVTTSEAFNKPL